MIGTTGKMFVLISISQGISTIYLILLFLVKISLYIYLQLIRRSFAATNKIGAAGLRGRSWPDLDMLPFGRLTDAGGDSHHDLYDKFG